MNKKKKTGIIGILVTIVILIFVVILSNLKIENFSSVGSALGTVVMPIQNGFTYLKNKISGNSTFFSDINSLKEENKKLQEENSKLEQDLRELEVIKSENETLKEYVNLKEKYTEYTTVPGYVISKDTSNYSDIVIINVGSKDGIAEDMAVIADEGLVGHVISVTDKTAKVELLLDASSAVSSVVGSAKDTLVVKGSLDNNGFLKGDTIQTSATILVGDKVETSGMGGIYPKGITIGTIKEVFDTKNLSNRYVQITPAVNFDKLDTILVIKR